jgi:hypothetical protein
MFQVVLVKARLIIPLVMMVVVEVVEEQGGCV